MPSVRVQVSLFILSSIAFFVDAWYGGIRRTRRIPFERPSKTGNVRDLVFLQQRTTDDEESPKEHSSDASRPFRMRDVSHEPAGIRDQTRRTTVSLLGNVVSRVPVSRIMLTLLAVTVPTTIGTAAWASSSYNPQSIVAPTPVQQVQWSFRLITAAGLGAMIGQERSGHPAGVRTMALVSMGAAMFTICSLHGFGARADPSRMAANVASGVGFIGAGVITTSSSSKVHGLTTAAAIWLSAAVGVGCASGLALMSSLSSVFTVTILRIGKMISNAEVKSNLLQQGKAIFLTKARDASSNWVRNFSNYTDSDSTLRRP